MNFEGIASPSNPTVQIRNYYNGGAGTDYGISFSSTAYALCLNTTTQSCSNTSRGGQGDPTSQEGGLIFLNGSNTFMDDASGFATGFSLFYSAPFDAGSLSVYSGVDGTGSLLATLGLPITPDGPCPGESGNYCPFVPVGVTFSGTAESIEFAGVADYIAFDDVTFGSATPGQTGVTPEPASLALLGTGMLGVLGAARKRFV